MAGDIAHWHENKGTDEAEDVSAASVGHGEPAASKACWSGSPPIFIDRKKSGNSCRYDNVSGSGFGSRGDKGGSRKVSPVKSMAPLPFATTLDPTCSIVMGRSAHGHGHNAWRSKKGVELPVGCPYRQGHRRSYKRFGV